MLIVSVKLIIDAVQTGVFLYGKEEKVENVMAR